ncbi:MAG: regulator of protease activity HflC (stomatin/prohibitin superfamily) [Verrucomicrobiales bacterium]|jgi:regulator of protease activity HflC (stomatin/prohibitin superfamily)
MIALLTPILADALTPTVIILLFLLLLTIVLMVAGLKLVRHAETMVIERLGRYNRTLNSGLNVIWPIIDRARSINWRYVNTSVDGKKTFIVDKITPRLDLRETIYDFPKQNVITKDNVAIEINALVYFQLTDPMKAVYEIANLPDAIEKMTQTTLRNVIGELDLDETLVSRDTINKKLVSILDEATDKWGVKVNRVELQDIIPPVDIQQAMEKQMRAERDRRAVILTAEGAKRAQVLEAEGHREAQVNMAEGDRQAQILRASGEGEARERIAQAEKEAIGRVSEAFADQSADPSTYLIAMRYIDTLKSLMEGQDNKTVYLPYEATGVLGSLGAVKEMFKH